MNRFTPAKIIGATLICGTVIMSVTTHTDLVESTIIVNDYDTYMNTAHTANIAASLNGKAYNFEDDILIENPAIPGITPQPNPNPVPTQIAHKAEDLYTKVAFGKGSPTSYVTDGVPLYNGNPWDDDGQWYRLDYDRCAEYIRNVMNTDLKRGTINADSAKGNKGTINHDGIDCHRMSFSPTMAWVDCDESGFHGGLNGWSSSRAAECYGCAVFEKDGQLYYWPITGGDNMGHAWPGGVAQTMIPCSSSYDQNTGLVTMDLWDVSWDGVKNQRVIVNYEADILSGDCYTKHLGYSKWQPPAYASTMPDYHCEMLATCKSFFDNNHFKFQYYIIHRR